jgi:uncharacterized protein (DUF2164 family)
MPIHFSDDAKKRIHEALQAFVAEHFDQEIGQLKSQLLFEFVVKSIGATIYNQAIADAQEYVQGKALDMEGDLYEPVEFEPPEG